MASGAITGLLLGRFLWGTTSNKEPLSKYIDTLSDILKQIKGIKIEGVNNLKNRINKILETLESGYGDNKK